MTRPSHAPHQRAHQNRENPDRAGRSQGRKSGDQGIVRDERGQEQPADKERAQQVSKSE